MGTRVSILLPYGVLILLGLIGINEFLNLELSQGFQSTRVGCCDFLLRRTAMPFYRKKATAPFLRRSALLRLLAVPFCTLTLLLYARQCPSAMSANPRPGK